MLRDAQVAHFDTRRRCGWRPLRWVHSASTSRQVRADHRARQAWRKYGRCRRFPGFTGVAVHDRAPYDTPARCCTPAATRARSAGTAGGHRSPGPNRRRGRLVLGRAGRWSHSRAMKRLVDEALPATAPPERYRCRRRWPTPSTLSLSAARLGVKATAQRADNPRQERPQRPGPAAAGQTRRPPAVHLDPAGAVRQQRRRARDPMIKIRQKVVRLFAHCRSEQFCVIRSYLATTAKHRPSTARRLTRLTNGRPWLSSQAESAHRITSS